MIRALRFLALSASIALALTMVATLLSRPAKAQQIECQAPRAVDGDTIACRDGLRIRLWGIDAPESGQPGGDIARTALEATFDLWPPRAEIRCTARGADRYGRVTAICRSNSIEDIGRQLVMWGWAWDFPRYSHGAYAPEERAARRERRGLWAHQAPQAPWQWRAERRNTR